MGLKSFVRSLVPNDDRFYGFLEGQGRLALEGARALAALRRSPPNPESVREAVQRFEHQADAIVHQMEDALARTFMTPIDRDELKSLSDGLDDVLDLTNGAARACDLMGISAPTPAMLALVDKLVACAEVLADAVPHMRTQAYPMLMEASRHLRRLEKESDAIYREEIRRLFHDPGVDAKQLLREKEILDDLEKAIDCAEVAGETMAHIALKHG